MEVEAAAAKRDIWKAHDERDYEACREAAYRFFAAFTDGDVNLEYAGEMVRRAFWLADEGEKYQSENSEIENHFYNCAEECLREAFEEVGLPEKIAKYRRDWWQGYRHDEDISEPLSRDLQLQVGDRFQEQKVQHFVKAAKQHDQDNWEQCRRRLEEVYDNEN